MLFPWGMLVVAVVPLFSWIQAAPTGLPFYTTVTVLALLSPMSISAGLLTIAALLPRDIRASGLALSYAVGVSIFGGSTQFVITWLIGATGSPVAPAWCVVAMGVIGGIAMWMLPETHYRTAE